MKIYYENLVIIVSPKTIRVNLPRKINQSLKHDIKFIVVCDEYLAEYTIKNKIIQLLLQYQHE